MGLLDGKVAIVTGGAHGIGRAEALLFAREGARVVVADTGGERDGSGSSDAADVVVAEIRGAGGEAIAVRASVCEADGAEAIASSAIDAFGRIDVLVNGAGIVRDKSLLKMDRSSFEAVIEVDLVGTFLCTQAVVRRMLAQPSLGGAVGRIVNTTAIAGLRGNAGQTNLAAAKGGVFGLTRTSAIELQKHRIYVNALAPIAKTRMTADLPMFESVESMQPEHAAPAALFLASDLAGDRTGHVLAVAGAQMYAFKVVQTAGRFKDGGEPWTAEEIAENWDAIVKS